MDIERNSEKQLSSNPETNNSSTINSQNLSYKTNHSEGLEETNLKQQSKQDNMSSDKMDRELESKDNEKDDDDLEDGEIETDDDDDEPIITSVTVRDSNHDAKTKFITSSSQISTITPTAPTSNKTFPSKTAIGGGGIGSVGVTSATALSTSGNGSPKIDSDLTMPTSKKSSKIRRTDIVDDDWAGNIENAIAAALKKDGIEPPMPKLSKNISGNMDIYDKSDKNDYVEDIRRARKRKKREERENKKSKRMKILDTDHYDDMMKMTDEIDEDEMVCVRGGSPSITRTSGFIPHHDHHHGHHHHRRSPTISVNSEDSFQSSYDSYDSGDNRKMSFDDRRQSRRNKDRRNRGGSQTVGSGAGRGGGAGKRRNRHDSDGGDDCSRSHDARAPRKLELCKFYLMNCCAKKDKCSYMHADFPCKYYYLGMECVYKSECKFSHGDPLTEQLKNILLKHIETAPKEILGNFRRISREAATNQLLATHAKLCAEKGIENTFDLPSSPQSSSGLIMQSSSSFGRQSRSPAPLSQSFGRQSRSPSDSNRGSGNPFASSNVSSQPMYPSNDEEDWDKDDRDKAASTSNNSTNNLSFSSSNKSADKPRKSRWRDFSGSQSSTSGSQPTSVAASDILSLKNLKGVITPEQIERLEAIGIENLEQISQLTVAQLNSVGLTISQINEIQLNAMNIQKLGLISQSASATTTTASTSSVLPSSANLSQNSSTSNLSSTIAATHSSSVFNDDSQSVSQDVDMRFLVGAVQASGTSKQASGSTVTTNVNSQLAPLSSQITESSTTSSIVGGSQLQDLDIASPEPTPNSGKIGTNCSNTMDFSQYLKDSNLKDADKTDFNDLLKEDKEDDDPSNEDEPELLIDESRYNGSDDESGIASPPKPIPRSVFTTKGEDDDDWDDDGDIPAASTTQHNTSDYRKEDSDSNYRKEDADQWQENSNDRWQSNEDNTSWQKSNNTRWQQGQQDFNNERGKMRWQQNKTDSWMDSKDDFPWQKKTNSPSDFYGGAANNSRNDRSDYSGFNSNSSSRRDDYYGGRNQQRNDPRNKTGSSYEDKDSFYDRSSSSMASGQFRDPRLGGGGGSLDDRRNFTPNQTKSTKPVDNYEGDWDADEDNVKAGDHLDTTTRSSISEESSSMAVIQQDVIPSVIREPSPPPKYQRASIYDGAAIGSGDDDEENSRGGADDDDREYSGDRDMRVSSFLESGDIDLRLPFKPVMTNYTPATEIDGSIASHAPIPYKVYEVSIPKPDYSEIRRTMTVTEKTLDPRLRRIFCLKEPIGDQFGTDSDMLRSPPHTAPPLLLGSIQKSTPDPIDKTNVGISIGGPRLDPRRRKENADGSGASSLLSKPVGQSQTSGSGLGQNVDIRMLLQKSVWYKNLNSKFKIMVNQQLALVSTELKKFHQDPNPDKVFDMNFLATNQYLQQVLTNLGIFIDSNGQILQLDAENEDPIMGGAPVPGPGMLMPGGNIHMESIPPLTGMGGMDFMRPSQPPHMGPMNPQFMNPPGMMHSFPPRFGGDVRTGLLGVQPPPKFNPFGGNPHIPFHGGMDDYGGDQHQVGGNNPFEQGGVNDMPGGGGNKFYGGSDRPSSGGGGGNRGGGRNFRQGGGGNPRNDRWSGGNQGRNNQGRNRNYDNRSGGSGGGGNSGNDRGNNDRDSIRRDAPVQQEEEEDNWD